MIYEIFHHSQKTSIFNQLYSKVGISSLPKTQGNIDLFIYFIAIVNKWGDKKLLSGYFAYLKCL